MRAAFRLTALAGLIALAACNKGQPPQEQNTAVTEGNMEGADIETLPPDESSGTPSNELLNGNDNPDVNDAGVNSD